MKRLRGVSLLIALSLLTSTATAYAECAWVLWNENKDVSTRKPHETAARDK